MSESSRLKSWIISGTKHTLHGKTVKWATSWLKAVRVSHCSHAHTPPPPRFGTGTTRAQQVFINEIFDLKRYHLRTLNLSKMYQYRRAPKSWIAISCRAKHVRQLETTNAQLWCPDTRKNIAANHSHLSLQKFLV